MTPFDISSLGKPKTKNRRGAKVILVDIELPGTFDYFSMLDDNGVLRYYWLDLAGVLAFSDIEPTTTTGRGLAPFDITPSATPNAIQLAQGGAGPNRWLVPDVFDGQLNVVDSLPSGQIWIEGAELPMYTMSPKEQMSIVVDDFDTLSYETPIVPKADRDDTHSRFSSGSVSPYFRGHLWDSRVIGGYDIKSQIGDMSPFSGRIISGVGRIDLARGRNGLPSLDSTECVGCPVEITDVNGEIIHSAEIARVSRSTSTITLVTADAVQKMRKPLQKNRYEDSELLGGVLKPLCFGYVQHITPVLRDAVRNIYQYHDGISGGVDAVRVGGLPVEIVGTISDIGISTLEEWNPGTAPQVLDDPTRGEFAISVQPLNDVTCDAYGDARQGMPQTTPGIIQLIADEYAGVRVDTQSFANIDDTKKIGVYVDYDVQMDQLCTDLARPAQSFFGFSRAGVLVYGRVAASPPVATILRAQLTAEPRSLDLPLPPWQVQVDYARCYTVATGSELLTGASASVKQFAQREVRSVSLSNVSLLQQHGSGAEKLEIGGYYQTREDAELAAREILPLRSRVSQSWELKVLGHPLAIRAGDTVDVESASDGMGGNYIVVYASDRTDSLETTLKIWGPL